MPVHMHIFLEDFWLWSIIKYVIFNSTSRKTFKTYVLYLQKRVTNFLGLLFLVSKYIQAKYQ
jgi:hypothetical protein